MLYPGEIVIHDGNVDLHKTAQFFGDDGQPRSYGLVPRNYQTHPLGCYPDIKPYTAVSFPLIPREEWAQRAKDQLAAGARLSDMRMRGNKGQMIPSRDQNGRGYCWRHSPTSANLLVRARMNLPYVDLSAYAGACRIKNYRDEGGWGAQGLDDVIQFGDPSSEFWPQKSVSRSNDTPEMRANALLHRGGEGWIDLAVAQYDRKLAFEQEISLYLTASPCIKDHNWWSHSICGCDAVDGSTQRLFTRGESGKLLQLREFDQFWGMLDPVTAGWGIRIWNSWGDGWGAQGMGVLTGKQAVSDGSVGLLTTTASVT